MKIFKWLFLSLFIALSTADASYFIPNGAVTRPKLATGAVANVSYRSVTTTDTATTSDDVLVLSGASFTQTLFTAVGNSGKIITLKHNGTNFTQAYTLATTGGQTIGGVASGSYVLRTNGETLKIMSDNSNWVILDHVTDTGWFAVTVTGTWVTNTTYTAYMRRTGDTANYKIRVAVTGAPTSTALTITLNNSLTIDTGKIDNTSFAAIGGGLIDDASGADHPLTISTNSTTTIRAYWHNVVSIVVLTTVDQTGPMTWANGDFASMFFSVPISGWQP